MPVGKRLRFEVFKRDGFTCQYCGRKAPEVILHVDHISPVSKGGDNDLLNLITSCLDCNLGKADKLLDDDTALVKRRAQLDELNEKREQLEMMLEWAESLKTLTESVATKLKYHWAKLGDNKWWLNETGMVDLKKLLRKFQVDELIRAMELAAEQYFDRGSDGQLTADSVQLAWSKVGGVAALSKMPADKRALYYVRAILRRRLSYLNEHEMWRLLNAAIVKPLDVDTLKQVACTSDSWRQWRDTMVDMIAEGEAGE